MLESSIRAHTVVYWGEKLKTPFHITEAQVVRTNPIKTCEDSTWIYFLHTQLFNEYILDDSVTFLKVIMYTAYSFKSYSIPRN